MTDVVISIPEAEPCEEQDHEHNALSVYAADLSTGDRICWDGELDEVESKPLGCDCGHGVIIKLRLAGRVDVPAELEIVTGYEREIEPCNKCGEPIEVTSPVEGVCDDCICEVCYVEESTEDSDYCHDCLCEECEVDPKEEYSSFCISCEPEEEEEEEEE